MTIDAPRGQGAAPGQIVKMRASLALKQCLPDQLKDLTFKSLLKEDPSTMNWLRQLLTTLGSFMKY